jgi:nitroreductase
MHALYKYIFKRRSIRNYNIKPLQEDLLNKIKTRISEIKPLYADIRVNVEIVNSVKGPLKASAPHYLLFSSEEKDGAYENIGFIGQQLSIWLTSQGLGSCWQGAARPDHREDARLPFVIAMSFGEPGEPAFREASGFKRKSLAEISEGSDFRLEAARLAPSGVNSQNWYFVCEEGRIHVYRKKVNPVTGIIYNKMNCIDIGIAVCHLYLAGGNEAFDFGKLQNHPERKGFIYMGTMK